MLIAAIVWILADMMPVFEGSFFILMLFAAAVGLFAIILLLYEAVKILTVQQQQLERISDTLALSKNVFEQINRGVTLSETAKTIAYKDKDTQYLRSLVMEKLHQQDFTATYLMIEDIGKQKEYEELVAELKTTADTYRDATEQDRINQIISYIEKLFEQYQWVAAGVQIETIIKKYPDSERAKQLQRELIDRKEQRKRQLLAEWDEAVKRADTDKSLLILKDLDTYLTPGEGLALQESASDVFKNKLHNLGVRFSLDVSDKHWSDALITGQELIRNFPNSKMADEIRSKLPVLRELAKKQPLPAKH
jgi:hypothetical protein